MQSAIVRLSSALLADSQYSKEVSELWLAALYAAGRDRILPLMYVVNDVLAKAAVAKKQLSADATDDERNTSPAVWVQRFDDILDDAMDIVAFRSPENVSKVTKIV